ncbi:FAD-dependent monooxygenase [Streptomyces durmitorensis]|uniref:FAD-dependent monooxygenase n=1 Tax=Streptomyces durmitorensis TaxID=319947 RepID=A0ABY4PR79_9ACTN|nr:FAD-dependent monooxygenase [Streptomyces durmitorensis]UQT55404.1 FAD-dependent monooxygenase [Streptomyces durmitorensis]
MRGGRVAIVGGSIAGCAAALAAYRGGADEITVYERAAGHLADRGVGLAVHNSRYAELDSAGYLDADMPWVQLERRRWYVRDGSAAGPLGHEIGAMAFPFRTYNWGPLWRELRGRVPDSVVFRSGVAVEQVRTAGEEAEVDTAEGTERVDLVIGADGYRSVVRAAAFAGVRPAYAGYLAWRGAFPADRLTDPELWAEEDCVYVVFPGGHAIVYRIPDGVGGHRVNWVLYTAPPPDLDLGLGLDLRLTAPTSLPPGGLTEALSSHLTYVCDELLPPYWGDLVRTTTPDELFLQPMYDYTAPRYTTGRVLLMGDAATVARPHTGAGAVKALQDATVLESAFATATTWPDALDTYDTDRTVAGAAMVDLGRRLGHSLVEETPPWRSMDQTALETWWKQADGGGTFGGRALRR